MNDSIFLGEQIVLIIRIYLKDSIELKFYNYFKVHIEFKIPSYLNITIGGQLLDDTQFFECQCNSDEHTLRFILDKDDKEIYTHVFLHQYSFITRVHIAIRYIFGYKCKYGHWDSFLLKPEDAKRLIDMLEKI